MTDCYIIQLRVTAQVLQFVELTRKKSLNVFKVCYNNPAVEAVELNRAEALWIYSVQAEPFQREIGYLKGLIRRSLPTLIYFICFG